MMKHDSVRRAVRTFLQAFLAALAVTLPTDLVLDAAVYVEALTAAGYAAVVALVTWLHNEVEDLAPKVDTRQPKRKEPTP